MSVGQRVWRLSTGEGAGGPPIHEVGDRFVVPGWGEQAEIEQGGLGLFDAERNPQPAAGAARPGREPAGPAPPWGTRGPRAQRIVSRPRRPVIVPIGVALLARVARR